MINLSSIKQKIQLFALAIPVLADDSTLKFSTTTDFESATTATPNSFISGFVSLSLIIAVIVFFFTFILGGIKWITSNGDEKKLAAARSQITHGLIGIVLIFSSYAVLNLIDVLFGFDILGGLNIPSLSSSFRSNLPPKSGQYHIEMIK